MHKASCKGQTLSGEFKTEYTLGLDRSKSMHGNHWRKKVGRNKSPFFPGKVSVCHAIETFLLPPPHMSFEPLIFKSQMNH